MAQDNLAESLQELVRRHGLSSVLHSLADIQTAPEQSTSSLSTRRTRSASRKSSAVDYVGKMTLPPDKDEAMKRAAQRFEDGGFLPSVADIREFCRINAVELGKSVSRASSIPRVFTFLATMDTVQITKLLDEGAFSGPTRLAPIADAIRSRSTRRRRGEHDLVQPVADTSIADRSQIQ